MRARSRTTSAAPHSTSLFAVESHHTAARRSLLFLPPCHSALCSRSHYCTAQSLPLLPLLPLLPRPVGTCTALTPCPPPNPGAEHQTRFNKSVRMTRGPKQTRSGDLQMSVYIDFGGNVTFWVFFSFSDRGRWDWMRAGPAVPSNLYARGQTALCI